MIYVPIKIAICIIVAVACATVFTVRRIIKNDLKEGSNFTIKEKRVLLKAIKQARKYCILKNGDSAGLCGLLESSIYAQGYQGLYKALEYTYHTREYYHAKGLRTYNYNGYWWELSDIESRLKALDILEQAIIND